MTYLAIDIGGTFIKYAYIDEKLNIYETWKVPTDGNNKTAFLDYIHFHIPAEKDFVGIGISVPGIVNADGIVLSKSSSKLNGLYQQNLKHYFFEKYHVPVTVLNDGTAAGLYECKFGNLKHCKTGVCLVIGTGIGGSLSVNGELIPSTNNISGEFHMIPVYNINGQTYKNLGDFCKIKVLQENYYALTGKKYSCEKIFDLYKAEEVIAQTVVSAWVKDISFLLLTIMAVYNPEIICIGGGISENDLFMSTLTSTYEKLISVHYKKFPPIPTKIYPCSERNRNNLLGAIIYLINSIK